MAKKLDDQTIEAQGKADEMNIREYLANQKKVRIKIPLAQGQEHQEETVCVNGFLMQLQRGVHVEVPELVAEILEQSGRL
mgnify:CR=1 FL=1